MSAAGSHRAPAMGADPRAGSEPVEDTPRLGAGGYRASIRSDVTTAVLCGPVALVVLVLVGRHGWPVWWLVIAGMLLAWAGDALWALGDHLLRGTGTEDQP